MPSDRSFDNLSTLLEACEQRIGYRFRDQSILAEALTHASGASDRLSSNERLEFLGDSILGFVVCERLYELLPNLLEGELTRIKSALVSRATCAKIGESLGLEEFLVLGKGMDMQRGLPNSLVANALESLIAAIYIDAGIEEVRKFVLELLAGEIKTTVSAKDDENYKSALQQFSQREYGVPPTYKVLDEQGPDHDKSFQICAQIGKRRFTPAWGNNKKEAEQNAANNALSELDDQSAPHTSEY